MLPRSLVAAASIAAIACFPAGLFGEAAPESLTVEAALKAALANNLAVKSAAVESRIKKRNSDFSFNKFLPSVSVSATPLELNSIAPVLVGLPPSTVFYYQPDRFNIALGLTVQEVFSPIYFAMMDQAAIDYQRSLTSLAQAERSMGATVKKVFYQLLVQDEAISLTRSRLDGAKERLRQTQVSYQLGQASELNFTYATMNVESLIPELRSMETAKAAALIQFQEILGFEPRQDLKLVGSLDEDTVEAGSVAASEEKRFDVRLARQSVQQLESALKSQSYALLPSLILRYSADPTINGPQNHSIWNSANWMQSTGAVSLTLSWSLDALLPGSSLRVAKGEIVDRLALAREATAQALRSARDEAANQASAVQDSVAKIGNLTNVASASERAYQLTNAAYQLGTGRYLDLQDAEVAWQGARMQILSERLKLASLVYDFEAKFESPGG